MQLDWQIVPQAAVSTDLEQSIRTLLVAAFPAHADFFAQASWRGSVPEFRLVGLDRQGQVRAHLGCGRRAARVGAVPVSLLGIGAVAVHPQVQGQGVGRALFAALRQQAVAQRWADFGLLECREPVAGFYRRAGLCRVAQPCRSRHHDSGAWQTWHGPVMVLPLCRPVTQWPAGGVVDLGGMSW